MAQSSQGSELPRYGGAGQAGSRHENVGDTNRQKAGEDTTHTGARDYYMTIIMHLLEALGYDVEAIRGLLGHMERRELCGEIQRLRDSRIFSKELADKLRKLHQGDTADLNDISDQVREVLGSLGDTPQGNIHHKGNTHPVSTHSSAQGNYNAHSFGSQAHYQFTGIPEKGELYSQTGQAIDEHQSFDHHLDIALQGLENRVNGEVYSILLGCKQLASYQFMQGIGESAGNSLVDIGGLLTAARRKAGSEAVRLVDQILRSASSQKSVDDSRARNDMYEHRVQELLRENTDCRSQMFVCADQQQRLASDNHSLKQKLEDAMMSLQNTAFTNEDFAVKAHIKNIGHKLSIDSSRYSSIDVLKLLEDRMDSLSKDNMRLRANLDATRHEHGSQFNSGVSNGDASRIDMQSDHQSQYGSRYVPSQSHGGIVLQPYRGSIGTFGSGREIKTLHKDEQKGTIQITEKEIVTKYVPISIPQPSSNSFGQANSSSVYIPPSRDQSRPAWVLPYHKQAASKELTTKTVEDRTDSTRVIYLPTGYIANNQQANSAAWRLPDAMHGSNQGKTDDIGYSVHRHSVDDGRVGENGSEKQLISKYSGQQKMDEKSTARYQQGECDQVFRSEGGIKDHTGFNLVELGPIAADHRLGRAGQAAAMEPYGQNQPNYSAGIQSDIVQAAQPWTYNLTDKYNETNQIQNGGQSDTNRPQIQPIGPTNSLNSSGQNQFSYPTPQNFQYPGQSAQNLPGSLNQNQTNQMAKTDNSTQKFSSGYQGGYPTGQQQNLSIQHAGSVSINPGQPSTGMSKSWTLPNAISQPGHQTMNRNQHVVLTGVIHPDMPQSGLGNNLNTHYPQSQGQGSQNTGSVQNIQAGNTQIADPIQEVNVPNKDNLISPSDIKPETKSNIDQQPLKATDKLKEKTKIKSTTTSKHQNKAAEGHQPSGDDAGSDNDKSSKETPQQSTAKTDKQQSMSRLAENTKNLADELDRVNNDLRSRLDRISILEQQLRDSSDQVKLHERQIEQNNSDLERLRSVQVPPRIDDQSETIGDLMAKLQKKSSELEKMKAEVSSKDVILNELRNSLKNQEVQIEDAKIEKIEKNENLDKPEKRGKSKAKKGKTPNTGVEADVKNLEEVPKHPNLSPMDQEEESEIAFFKKQAEESTKKLKSLKKEIKEKDQELVEVRKILDAQSTDDKTTKYSTYLKTKDAEIKDLKKKLKKSEAKEATTKPDEDNESMAKVKPEVSEKITEHTHNTEDNSSVLVKKGGSKKETDKKQPNNKTDDETDTSPVVPELSSKLEDLKSALSKKDNEVENLKTQISSYQSQGKNTSKLVKDLQTLKEDLQNKDKEIEDLREALAKAKRDPTNEEGGLYKIISQKDAEIEELKAILPQSKVNPLLLHPRKSHGADNTLKPSINSDRDSKLDDSHLFQISKESDRYLSNTPLLHSINYDKMQKEEQKQIQQLITELSNKDTKINQLQKSIETMVKANEPQAISQSQMGEKKIESDIAKSTLTQMKSLESDKPTSQIDREIIEELANILCSSRTTERESKSSKNSKSQTTKGQKKTVPSKSKPQAEPVDAVKVLEQVKAMNHKVNSLEIELQQRCLDLENALKKATTAEKELELKKSEISDLQIKVDELQTKLSTPLEGMKITDMKLEDLLGQDSPDSPHRGQQPGEDLRHVKSFSAEVLGDSRVANAVASAQDKKSNPSIVNLPQSNSQRDLSKMPPKAPMPADGSRKDQDKLDMRRSRGAGQEQNTFVSFPGTDDSQFQVNELLEDIKKLQDAKDKLQGMVNQLLTSEEASKIGLEISNQKIEGESPNNRVPTQMLLGDSPSGGQDSKAQSDAPKLDISIRVEQLEQKIFDKLNLINQLHDRISSLESENRDLSDQLKQVQSQRIEEKVSIGSKAKGKDIKPKQKLSPQEEAKKAVEGMSPALAEIYKKLPEASKARVVQASTAVRDDIDKTTKQELIAKEVKIQALNIEKAAMAEEFKKHIEDVDLKGKAAVKELGEAKKGLLQIIELKLKLEESKTKYNELQEENKNMVEALEEIRQQISEGKIIIKDEEEDEPKDSVGLALLMSQKSITSSKKESLSKKPSLLMKDERTSINSQNPRSSTKSVKPSKVQPNQTGGSIKKINTKGIDNVSDMEQSKSNRVAQKTDNGESSRDSEVHEIMRLTTEELANLQQRYNNIQERFSEQSGMLTQAAVENKTLRKELDSIKASIAVSGSKDQIEQLKAIKDQMLDDGKSGDEVINENAELIKFMKKANCESAELKEKYIEAVDYLDKFVKDKFGNESSNEEFLEAIGKEHQNSPVRSLDQLKQFNHNLWEAVVNERKKMNNLSKRIQTVERWSEDQDIGQPDDAREVEENLDLPFEKLPEAVKAIESSHATKALRTNSDIPSSRIDEGSANGQLESTERTDKDPPLPNDVLVDLLLSIVGLIEELRQISYEEGLPDSEKIKIIQEKLDNFDILNDQGGLDLASVQRMIQTSKDQDGPAFDEIREVSPEEEEDEDSKRAKSSMRQKSGSRRSRIVDIVDSSRKALDSKGTSSEETKRQIEAEVAKRVMTLEDSKSQLEEENSVLKKTLEQLRGELEQAISQIGTQKQIPSKLIKQTDKSEVKIATKTPNAIPKNQKKETKTILKKNDSDESEAEITKNRDTLVDSLLEEIANLKQQLLKPPTQSSTAKKENIEEPQDNVKGKPKSITQIKNDKQVKIADKDIQATQKKLLESQKEITSLNEALSLVKIDLQKDKKLNEDITKELIGVKEKISAKQEEVNKLSKSNEVINSTLTKERAKVVASYERLNEKIEQQQAEIKRLTEALAAAKKSEKAGSTRNISAGPKPAQITKPGLPSKPASKDKPTKPGQAKTEVSDQKPVAEPQVDSEQAAKFEELQKRLADREQECTELRHLAESTGAELDEVKAELARKTDAPKAVQQAGKSVGKLGDKSKPQQPGKITVIETKMTNNSLNSPQKEQNSTSDSQKIQDDMILDLQNQVAVLQNQIKESQKLILPFRSSNTATIQPEEVDKMVQIMSLRIDKESRTNPDAKDDALDEIQFLIRKLEQSQAEVDRLTEAFETGDKSITPTPKNASKVGSFSNQKPVQPQTSPKSVVSEKFNPSKKADEPTKITLMTRNSIPQKSEADRIVIELQKDIEKKDELILQARKANNELEVTMNDLYLKLNDKDNQITTLRKEIEALQRAKTDSESIEVIFSKQGHTCNQGRRDFKCHHRVIQDAKSRSDKRQSSSRRCECHIQVHRGPAGQQRQRSKSNII